jgi:hypothetical protein
MKRLLLLTLAAAVAMSLVAIVGIRSSGSGGTASAVGRQVAIDLDEGTGWCNTIEATDTVQVGDVHKAAICVSAGNAIVGFNFELHFDNTVDTCSNTGQTGNGLDANPNLVALGASWDCSLGGNAYPYCNVNNNGTPVTTSSAAMLCTTVDETVPVQTGWEAIAVITWTATAPGSDALSWVSGSFTDVNYEGVTGCATNANCLVATVTKLAAPTPTPTTPPAAQCDIACVGSPLGLAANPPALNMKVGQPAQIVDLSATFINNGAVTQGAPSATCNFANAIGAEKYVSGGPDSASLVTAAVDPTKLAVRVVPYPLVVLNPSPLQVLPGDVCLSCTPSQVGKSIGDCLDPTKGAKGPFDQVVPPQVDWTYMPVSCQEYGYNPLTSVNTSTLPDGGCRDTIDNTIPVNGLIDWRGFSAIPDPMCVDVQAVGLIPLLRQVLQHDQTVVKTRQVEIQCLARGTYPVFVFAGSSQAAQYPSSGPTAADPNVANNNCGALLTVTCTQGPEMVKDCDVLTEGIQNSCNLWLMNPKFPGGDEPGTNPVVHLPPADANGCVAPDMGKGCLSVDVWLKSAADQCDVNVLGCTCTGNPPVCTGTPPECVGAWEHQVRYDHKIIRFVNDLNPDTLWWGGDTWTSWLESTGRIANCTISVLTEDWILEGCVTKDNPAVAGMQVGPCGEGIIERMTIVPQYMDLVYRGLFRPTKDNGVVTDIVDDNCEITDIYGEPMADTLPGQLTPVCGDLTITVRMLEGDTDLDCDVDVIDDAALALRYGSSWGLQLYDQWFDLEPKYADQDIDIKDLQFVFGRNYSTCQDPIPTDQSIAVPAPQPDP